MKKLILSFFILFALTANASTVFPFPTSEKPESVWSKILRCTWHVSCYQYKFGSTITTISSTDLLTAFPTVFNTDITNLNTDKIEATVTTLNSLTSASSLATIGTITSGTWHGTPIEVAYNGTGTTSPTLNQIILGNAGSGFKVVSGFGTSGQLLTSSGAGNPPSWTSASFDTTQDYNLTGTIRIKNLNASSTSANPIVLNGVSLNTPTVQGAVDTTLLNDGSGNLNWIPMTRVVATSTASVSYNSSTATTTLATFTIPGNRMNIGNVLKVNIPVSLLSVTNTKTFNVCAIYGVNSVCKNTTNDGAGVSNDDGSIYVKMTGNNATNSQSIVLSNQFFNLQGGVAGDRISTVTAGTITTDSTSNQTFKVDFSLNNSSANDGITTQTYDAVIYK